LMLISVMTIMKVQPMANYVHLVILRAESLTAGQKIHNVEARMIENKFAIEEILAHPIFGIGFTRHYRPQIYGPNDNLQWYLHNGYLWILLKMGILGLIPFLWFSYIFVKRGIKNWQSVEDRFFKAIVLGSVISYLGVALTNFACAYFMENWQTAVFGLSFGINEVIYRVEGIDSKFDQTSDYMLSIPLGDG
jgi:O-antigen ligase